MTVVDVHIDFAFPFSYIADEKMLQAIESEGKSFEAVMFRSYQLNSSDNTKKKIILKTE